MRRGKWAVVLAACIVLAAVAAAYAAGQAKVSPPEVVRAQRFELVDAEERVRIELCMGGWDGQRPRVSLLDEKGSRRATLGLDSGGSPGLALLDGNGEKRAWLHLYPGEARLLLAGEKSRGRAVLTVQFDGNSGLLLGDGKGNLRASVGSSSLLSPDSGPGLILYDEKGSRRAGLRVVPDGGPILELLDSSGRIIFHAPAAPKALPTAPGGLYDSFQTPSVIESYIDGEFTGWEGETIFKLDNGQIWQQSSYAYHYHYAYHPKVTIARTRAGYKMLVEGVDESVYVVRLK
jgi:hypothetical protein